MTNHREHVRRAKVAREDVVNEERRREEAKEIRHLKAKELLSCGGRLKGRNVESQACSGGVDSEEAVLDGSVWWAGGKRMSQRSELAVEGK